MHLSILALFIASVSASTPLYIIEVNDIKDISAAIKIIGSTKTPFAVKSAGYTSNPGFFSITGVYISLEKFKIVNLAEDKRTSFTAVYQALNRIGYTNQYGLGCDTVVSYEIVLPDGKIVTASKSSEPDLFFALRGGLNRFGIVTKIVFKTVLQPGKIYGGVPFFGPTAVPTILKATQNFHVNSRDPKASVVLTLGGGSLLGAILLSFYDGETSPKDFYARNRRAFASFSTTTLTKTFMEAVVNETTYWTQFTVAYSGRLLQYNVEPFHAYGKYAKDSAYPHKDSPLPLNIYFAWSAEANNAFWNDAIQKSLAQLKAVAREEGILTEGSVYPGYAYGTTTGDQLYGATNAARLRCIRGRYDPHGVMLLAGGF
ncbi:hypothetical protein BKA65DRAFT_527493 [Rhexocercosporidium sp. MPI-PUGE-AT-0058]|nr:hypothetical protein BKA65DRAFT_527493 [Rhexocercosporidium sp. MPI-PUGE-AT-0058]